MPFRGCRITIMARRAVWRRGAVISTYLGLWWTGSIQLMILLNSEALVEILRSLGKPELIELPWEAYLNVLTGSAYRHCTWWWLSAQVCFPRQLLDSMKSRSAAPPPKLIAFKYQHINSSSLIDAHPLIYARGRRGFVLTPVFYKSSNSTGCRSSFQKHNLQ